MILKILALLLINEVPNVGVTYFSVFNWIVMVLYIHLPLPQGKLV